MPLPTVHLLVAEHICCARSYLVTDPAQFYLGSIVPDAIHKRKDATLLDKEKTHLDKFCPGRKERTDAFLANNWASAPDRDILLGYAVHLYTDFLWMELLQAEFMQKYEAVGITGDSEFRVKYYADVDRIDLRLYEEYSVVKQILSVLETAVSCDFYDLIRAEEMDLWNERTRTWYFSDEISKDPPFGIVPYEAVDGFIPTCAESIVGYLDILELK